MLLKLTRRILTTTLLGALSVTAFAAGDREDYDLDDDGLIEINDLGDLDEIRNNLDGSSLYGSSEGCPETGCNGFELTTDLDFDTNGDGKMDGQDDYWNDGVGWVPIGVWDTGPLFSANFDGNGFSIKNIYINNIYNKYSALFVAAIGTENKRIYIKNLYMIGDLNFSKGGLAAAILVGYGEFLILENIVISGRTEAAVAPAVVAAELFNAIATRIFAQGEAVGLVDGEYAEAGAFAYILESELSDIISLVSVGPGYISSGLVASIDPDTNTDIENALALGVVSGSNSGGILSGDYPARVSSSYWATDTTGQETSVGEDPDLNYVGATLAELKCPIGPNNTTCAEDKNLYAGWSTDIWDFGTEDQLPGMIIGDIIFRDSDGDGNLDVNTQPSVSLRLTQDGTEETTIVAGEGDVTLEAIVTNLDLSERYKLAWSLEGIDGAVELGDTITFNTDDLPLGDYTLSVTVTDSGYPQMSDTAEMAVRVISNIPEPEETPDTTEAPVTKKKSSGGSAQWFWLVIAAMAFVRRNRFAV